MARGTREKYAGTVPYHQVFMGQSAINSTQRQRYDLLICGLDTGG